MIWCRKDVPSVLESSIAARFRSNYVVLTQWLANCTSDVLDYYVVRGLAY